MIDMSEVVINDTEILEVSTEILEEDTESMETSTEIADTSNSLDGDTLVSIDGKLSVIMFLLLFMFCWQCIRHWRNNVLKGVK